MGSRRSRPLRSCFLATAAALAAATLAGCSHGGEERETSGGCKGRIGATAAADVISTTGGRILRDIADASADFHRGYLLRAEREIDRADRTLDVIERSMPTAQVRRRIRVARDHLEYAEVRQVSEDLPPIYGALAKVERLAPADSIRGHLDRAMRRIERRDRKAAGRELERADQELLLVEIDLPLSSTRRHLAEAREALTASAAEPVPAYLQRAEDDLAFLTALARSPLEAAQWSLAKAVAAYQKADIDGAERYVTLARRSLGQCGGERSCAAHEASREVIEDLRGLDSRGLASDSADALGELEGLVSRVRALAHPDCG